VGSTYNWIIRKKTIRESAGVVYNQNSYLPENIMFIDRCDAGEQLTNKLQKYKDSNAVVVAIPRGGVVLGNIIAETLNLSLDIIVTRKLSSPFQKELAVGAVGPEGVCVLDGPLIVELQIDKKYLLKEARKETDEIIRRIKTYKGKVKPLEIKGKTVILVDDGIATGSTIEAAIRYLNKKKVVKIVVAVPVIAKKAVKKLENSVDKIIALRTLQNFASISEFYKKFPQVTDEEVIRLLKLQN